VIQIEAAVRLRLHSKLSGDNFPIRSAGGSRGFKALTVRFVTLSCRAVDLVTIDRGNCDHAADLAVPFVTEHHENCDLMCSLPSLDFAVRFVTFVDTAHGKSFFGTGKLATFRKRRPLPNKKEIKNELKKEERRLFFHRCRFSLDR
jgi:hypothetical protein